MARNKTLGSKPETMAKLQALPTATYTVRVWGNMQTGKRGVWRCLSVVLCGALCQGQGTLQQPVAARQGCQHEPYLVWHHRLSQEALGLLTNKARRAQSAGRLSHKLFSFKPAFPSTEMQGYPGLEREGDFIRGRSSSEHF